MRIWSHGVWTPIPLLHRPAVTDSSHGSSLNLCLFLCEIGDNSASLARLW